MARIMSVDNVTIYRMLVTRKMDSGKNFQTAFGPHDVSSAAKDYTFNSYWGNEPARKQKQKLEVVQTGRGECVLDWVTISTTYSHGGEEVNWDA